MTDTVISSYELYQLIQEPTHLCYSSASCIDLTSLPQPNIVMESGVLCHYIQIFTIKNFLNYYNKLDSELIERAINQFDWLGEKELIIERNIAYKLYWRFNRDVFLFK